MKIKRNIGLLVIVMSLIFLIQPFQTIQSMATNDSLQSKGSINGIVWSYNEHKEDTKESSLSISNSASISKSTNNTKTITTNMNLITGTSNIDFYYDRYVKFVMKDGENSPDIHEKGLGFKGTIGNKTGNIFTNSFYRYDWSLKYINPFNKSMLLGQAFLGLAGGLKYWSSNIYVGPGWSSEWFTTNVTVTVDQNHTVPIVDIFQEKYGELVVPEITITYYFDQNQTPGNLADDQVTLIEHLIPEYQLISVKTASYKVNVKQSIGTSVDLQGSYNLTGTYSQTTIGDQVLISDAKNFIFGWYGLESTTINYNQSGGFTIKGNLVWTVNNDITYASNGKQVSQDIRMPWWRSSNMTFNGIWSHKFSDQGTIVGKGALQSVVEAIRTRASTSAQDQLLIWANIIPSTMFGFSDTDNSGGASVRLNGSSLQILDSIMAVGLAEGVNLKQTYDYSNFVNAHSFWQLGTSILTNKTNGLVNQGVSVLNQTWGADPTSTDFSNMNVAFKWTNPVESNGKVVFNWGITYNNFPTTWSITDGVTEIVNKIQNMNIGYNYTLTVDPTIGEAVLSNTYSNSGFTNSTMQTMASNLFFATYQRDLFLGMQKTTDQADSTEGSPESSLTSSFGSTKIIDQTFGGTKQQYSLNDGSTYNTQTTVVNVITGEGTSGEPQSVNVSTYSPFASSWFGRNIGLSLLKWSADNRTNNPGVDWQFRENLVITSYPTWKGEGIVHDPTFSTVYSPTTTTSHSKGVAWDFNAIILALFITIPLFKSKFRYKNS